VPLVCKQSLPLVLATLADIPELLGQSLRVPINEALPKLV
jgi:hypothetical protein